MGDKSCNNQVMHAYAQCACYGHSTAQMGWECPLCGSVYAPSITRCIGNHGLTGTLSPDNPAAIGLYNGADWTRCKKCHTYFVNNVYCMTCEDDRGLLQTP